eukprot:5305144-Prymnesium_polylepis.1
MRMGRRTSSHFGAPRWPAACTACGGRPSSSSAGTTRGWRSGASRTLRCRSVCGCAAAACSTCPARASAMFSVRSIPSPGRR